MGQRTVRRRSVPVLAAVAATALTLAACGSGGDDGGGGGAGGGGESVGVSLITKTDTNPYFVTMKEGAQKAAEEQDVDLTTAAGKQDGDEQTQIQAIEDAIARGDQGILITPNGPGVNSAIQDARDAGLYVIALDTPPDPADIVDATYATDNFEAGRLIGEWTAGKLDGQPATIAMLDLFNDVIVSVDYQRDQGFLTGMGIDTADPKRNGDEAATGSYSGGDYTIVCNEPTNGAEDGGRTAMENCLTRNPDINVVYTINEPAAVGAQQALQAAGMEDVTVVSIDGSCDGVAAVEDGTIGATSMQYPLKMAQVGVETIADIARGGEAPDVPEDTGFINTGVDLVTDQAVDGVDSMDSTQGAESCWG